MMKNEELKPEMRVLVDVDGSLKPGKVIDSVRKINKNTGEVIGILGWMVATEPSGLHRQVTADKIHPRD